MEASEAKQESEEENGFPRRLVSFHPILVLQIDDRKQQGWESIETSIYRALQATPWTIKWGMSSRRVTLNLEKIRDGEYMCSSSWVSDYDSRRNWDWKLTPSQFYAFEKYTDKLTWKIVEALKGSGVGITFLLRFEKERIFGL